LVYQSQAPSSTLFFWPDLICSLVKLFNKSLSSWFIFFAKSDYEKKKIAGKFVNSQGERKILKISLEFL